MKNPFLSHIKHPIFLSGVALVVVIGAGSFAYYKMSQRPPHYDYVEAKTGTVVQQVKETGTVKAATEVDLGFQLSGQIAHVYAQVGAQVGAGQVLASLQNADLAAQLASAQAGVQSAQAKLQSIQAGTRPEQLAIDQTAVDQANLALSNSYSGAATTLENGYISANDAVRKQMGPLFSNAEQSNPSLTFQVSNSQDKVDVESARVVMTAKLNAWQGELAPIGAASSPAVLDTVIGDTQKYLADAQGFLVKVNTALNEQAGVSAANLAAYQTALTAAQTEVSGTLAATVSLKQALASEAAAVTQAQNNLNLAKAGATSGDIAAQSAAVAAAQASVLNAQAQLEKSVVRAPVSGMITKSDAKVGQNASPNVPVISLISNGTFQIQAYLTEADVAAVQVGDQAAVTLDAYGPDTTFPATVISVDSAQTIVNDSPAYKAVLQFAKPDSRLKADLTANVIITTATHTNVVLIPQSAIIRRNADRFVLVAPAGTGNAEERKVQTGIVSGDGMIEIISGLAAGDRVVDFGNSTNS